MILYDGNAVISGILCCFLFDQIKLMKNYLFYTFYLFLLFKLGHLKFWKKKAAGICKAFQTAPGSNRRPSGELFCLLYTIMQTGLWLWCSTYSLIVAQIYTFNPRRYSDSVISYFKVLCFFHCVFIINQCWSCDQFVIFAHLAFRSVNLNDILSIKLKRKLVIKLDSMLKKYCFNIY